MRILVAGAPGSGQRAVVEHLTKAPVNETDMQGLVVDHEFQTRYFTARCPLWVDEFTDIDEWVAEFTSEQAAEVRDALTLFIYTCDPERPQFEKMAAFAQQLDPGRCIAVAAPGAATPADSDDDFDCIEFDELEPTVHTALFDAMDDAHNDSDGSGGDGRDPDPNYELDIGNIVDELKVARDSTTMSQEEKKALVDRIVGELTL